MTDKCNKYKHISHRYASFSLPWQALNILNYEIILRRRKKNLWFVKSWCVCVASEWWWCVCVVANSIFKMHVLSSRYRFLSSSLCTQCMKFTFHPHIIRTIIEWNTFRLGKDIHASFISILIYVWIWNMYRDVEFINRDRKDQLNKFKTPNFVESFVQKKNTAK